MCSGVVKVRENDRELLGQIDAVLGSVGFEPEKSGVWVGGDSRLPLGSKLDILPHGSAWHAGAALGLQNRCGA